MKSLAEAQDQANPRRRPRGPRHVVPATSPRPLGYSPPSIGIAAQVFKALAQHDAGGGRAQLRAIEMARLERLYLTKLTAHLGTGARSRLNSGSGLSLDPARPLVVLRGDLREAEAEERVGAPSGPTPRS